MSHIKEKYYCIQFIQTLAIKFGNIENAKLFYEAFGEMKKYVDSKGQHLIEKNNVDNKKEFEETANNDYEEGVSANMSKLDLSKT